MTHKLTNAEFPHNIKGRSRSADIFLAHERRKGGISKEEFERIRSVSRQSWRQSWENPGNPLPSVPQNHFISTYSTNHNYRSLDEETQSRPTSPTRRNNPHPTKVFLHLHLREASGFPKPKTKPGQDIAYRVGYRPEKEPIDTQRTMYYTLWEMKDLQRRGVDETLKAVMHPNSVPATQAWMKNASLKDQRTATNMLQMIDREADLNQTVHSTFKPDVVPAVNRWLKKAGREEQDAVERLMRTLDSDPIREKYIDPKYTGQLNPNRYLISKYDVPKPPARNLRYETKPRVTIHRPYRSDFTMHQEWLTA